MEKDRLRILFLETQPVWLPSVAVQHLVVSNLDRRAFEVHVACLVGPEGRPTEPYKQYQKTPDIHLRPTNFGLRIFDSTKRDAVKGLLSTGIAVPRTLAGLVRYAKRHRIDIIHNSDGPREALSGALIARLTGAKNVVHLHTQCGNWMRPSVLHVLRRADAVVGISRFVVDSAISFGFNPDRIHQADNAIDLAPWNYRTNGQQVRDELSIPPGAIVFATVAKIRPWKGQALTLRALATIRDGIPDFRYLVVGGGSLGIDTTYGKNLQRLAAELGIGQQVILTGARSDIPAVLAACDFCVMPFFEEGFGLAVMEAMAMRKAVIALDNGGPREFVEQGKSGLLSQPDDVEGLARNIQALATDDRLRAEMGAYGRRRVEEHFTPERLADDFERIYREIRRPDDLAGPRVGGGGAAKGRRRYRPFAMGGSGSEPSPTCRTRRAACRPSR
jgi:glycosyltransferase involved in cell wall biosynthesis